MYKFKRQRRPEIYICLGVLCLLCFTVNESRCGEASVVCTQYRNECTSQFIGERTLLVNRSFFF